MNLYGDCRTNIGNNPSTIYAEIFKITLYKLVGTEKVYTTNNRFRFSVTAGNIVKQYSFVSNKEKLQHLFLTFIGNLLLIYKLYNNFDFVITSFLLEVNHLNCFFNNFILSCSLILSDFLSKLKII